MTVNKLSVSIKSILATSSGLRKSSKSEEERTIAFFL
jgi:hypothetical protein